MYTFDSRIRYSEVGHTGRLTVPNLINYLQDCSTFQSEDLGVGLEVLKKKNRAWLLNSWHIVIRKAPALGDRVVVGTLAYDFKGLFGQRNFFMNDDQGQQLVCADSNWFYYDTGSGRPTRPEPEEVAAYGKEPRLEMNYMGRKISIPEVCVEKDSFPVRKYHIDTNEHVNNSQYVQMALETLDEEREVKELRVEYKRAAVLGDMVYPKVAEESGRTVVMLGDGEGGDYAVVEFIG
ncbi:acyl-[acyl-carrier-protein] thioesterase [Hespellia stercorisuis]|uniref:Acyl-ACP thioesterase n=1 Tax=Hespellia stercorisuis DSM 15480 TaxID=1121950 RepID=A0A1M6QLF9_9FIRM|nr:acyl-ACP thioesterase domain-containing protein [Hespellia stercorisuis]SHK20940.1 Acyl-ACP thioesterase [Hespellia stercorisuis DSM 15480]